ncbi:uncharacterized protein PAF06_007135 [Gastrophryne carolinensis]
MSRVKLTSLNVKGLNSPLKRTLVLRELRRLRAQVAFLQETHLKVGRTHNVSNRYYKTQYHSLSPDSKSRGVTILLDGSLPWTHLATLQDPEGRFLFVRGTLFSLRVTLATCYCPNSNQAKFIRSALNKLDGFAEGVLLLGGDFNTVLDPPWDTSRGSSHTPSSSLRELRTILYKHQLMDAWRIFNPRGRDYTFFSAPHNSYSRIDWFLIPHRFLHLITNIEIGQITISDHAPVSLTIAIPDTTPLRGQWRLNSSLLQDPVVKADIHKVITDYFASNDTGEVSRMSLWEAHKCVVRGVLIKHGARLKRERNKQIELLSREIFETETLHKKTLDAALGAKLTRLRESLRDICLTEAKSMAAKCRRFFYEYSNKCGKALARALKAQRARNFISHIRDRGGRDLYLTKDIARAFREFYENLYNLPSNHHAPETTNIEQYIRESGLPRLGSVVVEALEGDIELGEFMGAIKNTKPGRAPGPDGFGLDYYKEFAGVLGPHFITSFGSLKDGNPPPRDTLKANITVIPKPGKDPAQCGSYRPISLLNCDIKLFNKIIADRPETSLPILLAELKAFQTVSNYKINYQKSSALNISIPQGRLKQIAENFPFKWEKEAVTYLGTQITATPQKLYSMNFPPLLKKVEEDLQSWNRNAFSWFVLCSQYIWDGNEIKLFENTQSYLLDNSNKVVLSGRPGSISDALVLDDSDGSVIVSEVKQDDPVASGLGVKEGDELLGATIFFENLPTAEVLNILKATEPYKAGVQLHTKSKSTVPQITPYNMKRDIAIRPSTYDDIFNTKIRRYLKGSVSMQDLSQTATRGGQFKSTKPNYKLNTYSSSDNLSDIPYSEVSTQHLHKEINAPQISLKGHESQVQMPSANVSGPQIKNPHLDVDFKAPSMNILHKQNGAPDVNFSYVDSHDVEVNGKMKALDVELPRPNISGKVKVPEVNVATPNVQGPTFKLPSLNTPDFNTNMSEVQMPGVNIALPKVDIQAPKFKGPDVNVDVPGLDVHSPNVKVSGLSKADFQVKSSEVNVDLPKAEMKMPKLKGVDVSSDLPSLGLNETQLKGPKLNVDLPTFGVKGSKIPDTNVNLPTVNCPELNSELPNVDLTVPKIKGPNVSIESPRAEIPAMKLQGPDLNTDLPKGNIKMQNVKSPEVNIDLPNANLHMPKLRGLDLNGDPPTANIKPLKMNMPNLNFDVPKLDLKAPKLPKADFNIPQLKGPEVNVDLPKSNMNISKPKLPEVSIDTPTLDIQDPKLKGMDVKADLPKLDLKTTKPKGPELTANLSKSDINVPKLKGPEVRVDLPKADINIPDLKGPEVSVDLPKADVNIPKLKGPEVNVDLPKGGIKMSTPKTPDVNLDIPKPDMKPKFKMPSFNLFGSKKVFPDAEISLKTPHAKTGSLDLKGPKLDVNAPSVNVSGPKLKADLSGPEANAQLPEADVKGPKFKLPTFNMNAPKMKMPTFQATGPNVQAPGIDIDASMSTPKVDVNAPQINIKGPETDLSGPKFKKPSFNFPSFQMKTSDLKSPDLGIDASVKGPQADIQTPKMEIDVPSVNVSGPKVKADISGPEVNAQLPEGNVKGPKFKMPSLNMNAPNIKMPTFQATGPNIQAPDIDIDASLSTPKVDVNAPQLNIKGPETNLSGPKFKMPSLDFPSIQMKGPDLKTPDMGIDASIKGPQADIHAPEMDINVPRVNVSGPKVKADISGPEVNAQLPEGDVKGPKFKMPSLNIDTPKIKMPTFQAAGPNIQSPDIDIDASLSTPKVDVNAPQLNIKGPETNLSGPKFKMPSFTLPSFQTKSPDLKTPDLDIDASVKGPQADIHAPEIDVKCPDAEINSSKFKLPSLTKPSFQMPSFQMSGPKAQIPDVDASVKGPEVDLNVPQLDIKGPDTNFSSPKFKMPSFQMPTFKMSGPNVEKPDIDVGGSLKIPDIDLNAPKLNVKVPDAQIKTPTVNVQKPELEVSGSLNTPNLDVDGPRTDAKINAPRFKMPSFQLPSFEGSAPKVNVPDVEASVKSPRGEINTPQIDIKGPSTNINAPRFKIPTFALPGLAVDSSVKAPEVDIKAPSGNIKAPDVQLKAPNMPSVQMADANIQPPEFKVDGSLSTPKVDINVPDVNVKAPVKQVKAPKFKMPFFEMPGANIKNPNVEVDGSLQTPEMDIHAPQLNVKGGGNVTTPKITVPQGASGSMDLKMNAPKVEAKESRFKFPTLRIFHPKNKIPDADLGFESGNVDIPSLPNVQGSATLPNMNVSAPSASLKASDKKMTMPKFKMPTFGKSRSDDYDFKMKATDASLPQASMDVKGPELNASSNIKPPKFRNPEDLKVKVPELESEINMPSAQVKAPKITIEDTQGSVSLPSAKISSPGVNFPSTQIKTPGVEVSPPNFDMDLPSAHIKAPKIKTPNVNISGPKLTHDGLDDLDIDVPSARVHAPKWKEPFSGQTEGPAFDTNVPQIKGNLNITSPNVQSYQNNDASLELNGPKWKKPFPGQTEEPGEDVNVNMLPANTDIDLSSPTRMQFSQSKFSFFSENKFSIPDVSFDLSPPHLSKS